MLKWLQRMLLSDAPQMQPRFSDNELPGKPEISTSPKANEDAAIPIEEATIPIQEATVIADKDGDDKAMHERVLTILTSAVDKHIGMLALKKQQLIAVDDYGNADFERWYEELEYFYIHVVTKEFDNQGIDYRNLQTAAKYVWQNKLNGEPQYGHEMYSTYPDPYAQDYYYNTIDQHVVDYFTSHENNDNDNLDGHAEPEVTPAEYEHICADLLKLAGWTVKICGGTGDQGVDLLATKRGIVVAIQCKYYTKEVGNSAVQEVFAGTAIYGAAFGVVVAPSGYTRSAREAATETGVILMHHLDLAKLDRHLQ